MALEYRKITVAGINGAIGATLVRTLCEAGFEVQALCRCDGDKRPALGAATLVRINYKNRTTVEEVLRGQAVVISALGDTPECYAAQKMLIEASVVVGVKRFIPSEFGSDTMNPRVRSFPFFFEKLKHQELLRGLAKDFPDFSYTILITGAFLDWGLSVVPFILDVSNTGPQRYDGGDVPFSVTRIPTLAKAVVSLLKQSEATSNRTLYIHEALVTQNQIINCARRLNGSLAFSDEAVDMVKLEEEAWANLKKPGSNAQSWIFAFINISIWSREELCAFRLNDNELLGVRTLTGAVADGMVEEEVAKALTLLGTKRAGEAIADGMGKLDGFSVSFDKI